MLSALVGLANAIDGNEAMVTETTVRLICEGLRADENLEALMLRIRQEKARIAPGCAACKHPCGRTSDMDMALFATEADETRQLKEQIIDQLREQAKSPELPETAKLFRKLRAIGEYWDVQGLTQILNQ